MHIFTLGFCEVPANRPPTSGLTVKVTDEMPCICKENHLSLSVFASEIGRGFFQCGTKCYETDRVIEQKGGPDKITDLSGLNSIRISLLGKHFQLIGSVFCKGIWEM